MTNLEWKSAHGRLYVDVKNEKGEIVNWNFELPSPNTLIAPRLETRRAESGRPLYEPEAEPATSK